MHRAIMIYGPMDEQMINYTLAPYNEQADRSLQLYKCHEFPVEKSAQLMLLEITDTIQDIDDSSGKEFTDALMVMHKDDAETPWAGGFGSAGWVLAYKRGEPYSLYSVVNDGLWDWYEIGGRWINYLKPKHPDMPDAFRGEMNTVTRDLEPGVIRPGQPFRNTVTEKCWSSLRYDQVDWEELSKQFDEEDEEAVRQRIEFASKGVHVPTYREFFFTLYPITGEVDPAHLNGYLQARRWNVYFKYHEHLHKLRTEHGIEARVSFGLTPWRWSPELTTRLMKYRAKVLSCWMIGGVVYDLDDLSKEESHFHAGLNAIDALERYPETIVTVVDVHF